MNSHGKKMIAPIVITILFVIYFVAYFSAIIYELDGVAKYALLIIPLALCALNIKVCIDRIQEIKRGEEDDLSKY